MSGSSLTGNRAAENVEATVLPCESSFPDGVGENYDPTLFVEWNIKQVTAAVAWINENRPLLPAWMLDVYPVITVVLVLSNCC